MILEIIILLWIIGVIIAWFQIQKWDNEYTPQDPGGYFILGMASLLSWGIYVIYAVNKIGECINED
jgi:hypothetical protein